MIVHAVNVLLLIPIAIILFIIHFLLALVSHIFLLYQPLSISLLALLLPVLFRLGFAGHRLFELVLLAIHHLLALLLLAVFGKLVYHAVPLLLEASHQGVVL